MVYSFIWEVYAHLSRCKFVINEGSTNVVHKMATVSTINSVLVDMAVIVSCAHTNFKSDGMTLRVLLLWVAWWAWYEWKRLKLSFGCLLGFFPIVSFSYQLSDSHFWGKYRTREHHSTSSFETLSPCMKLFQDNTVIINGKLCIPELGDDNMHEFDITVQCILETIVHHHSLPTSIIGLKIMLCLMSCKHFLFVICPQGSQISGAKLSSGKIPDTVLIQCC